MATVGYFIVVLFRVLRCTGRIVGQATNRIFYIIRVRNLAMRPLESWDTMEGTMPAFYKILVIADLVRAVQLREYPAQETVVSPLSRRYSQGMKFLTIAISSPVMKFLSFLIQIENECERCDS